MENNNTFSTILKDIAEAKHVLIIYNGQTSVDIAAAATSLFCLARQNGQDVHLVSTTEPIVAHNALVGIDKARTKLLKRNFVISLDYDEAKIDKVVSHLDEENKKLLLIVQPRPSVKPLEAKDVTFEYEGVEYDKVVIFDVCAKRLLDKILGAPTSKNWQAEKIITFGTKTVPDYATSFNYPLDPEDCLSADFAILFRQESYAVDSDIASNLMLGLEDKTDNFAKCDNPEAFSLAAWLLENGARRHVVTSEQKKNFVKEHLPKNQTLR